MPEVQFEDSISEGGAILRDKKVSSDSETRMASWLIKKGIVKDSRSATNLMLVFVATSIVVTTAIVMIYASPSIFAKQRQSENHFVEQLQQSPGFQKLSPGEQQNALNQVSHYYGQ